MNDTMNLASPQNAETVQIAGIAETAQPAWAAEAAERLSTGEPADIAPPAWAAEAAERIWTGEPAEPAQSAEAAQAAEAAEVAESAGSAGTIQTAQSHTAPTGGRPRGRHAAPAHTGIRHGMQGLARRPAGRHASARPAGNVTRRVAISAGSAAMVAIGLAPAAS
jgi:hypothetical protein